MNGSGNEYRLDVKKLHISKGVHAVDPAGKPERELAEYDSQKADKIGVFSWLGSGENGASGVIDLGDGRADAGDGVVGGWSRGRIRSERMHDKWVLIPAGFRFVLRMPNGMHGRINEHWLHNDQIRRMLIYHPFIK